LAEWHDKKWIIQKPGEDSLLAAGFLQKLKNHEKELAKKGR